MLSNILIVLLILTLLFLVYQAVISKLFNGAEEDDTEESFYEENTSPGDAPIVGQKLNLPDNRVISPSGPNPPAHAPSQFEVTMHSPEQAPHDPYAEKYKSPHVDDEVRQPERSFRPAPEMNDVNTAVASGIASAAMGQAYSPEMIMNGGNFMDGVVGLESAEGGEIGYSAY